MERYGHTTTSPEDCLNRVLRLFFEDNNTSFKNLRCYNILIKCPKWCSYNDENSKKYQDSTTKKKRARSPSSDAPATTAPTLDAVSDFKANATDHSSLDCLIGNKKAKRLHHIEVNEQAWKQTIAEAHTLVANEQKRQNDIFNKEAQLLQMMAATGSANNDVMIMNQDLTNLDDDAREYFTLRRKQILASLRANSSSSS
ncbi:hypothetical protein PGTUg99_025852 [Puccinia graminis f. sp. tritici]|uniref:No apical meristem-associated C-terminal domain-containing protein n=2 Tax=Puccinia graminis f. sp. tritici TaxID=56615 RepID=E3JRJ1_PUCGT|nr:uncharacterized protein PGTG_00576 [Puccinia graminis f. sp. tritici CRL 75-36-700-3]EFP74620.2 hypothetical protein PGTG_00576 [Puccinia graminis f. sp. tritici CRL 75-36-700-3]KAA1127147.1 hypothetical protein PGTUg99_025852 [Puccinia graminis f. sp. tritici]